MAHVAAQQHSYHSHVSAPLLPPCCCSFVDQWHSYQCQGRQGPCRARDGLSCKLQPHCNPLAMRGPLSSDMPCCGGRRVRLQPAYSLAPCCSGGVRIIRRVCVTLAIAVGYMLSVSAGKHFSVTTLGYSSLVLGGVGHAVRLHVRVPAEHRQHLRRVCLGLAGCPHAAEANTHAVHPSGGCYGKAVTLERECFLSR